MNCPHCGMPREKNDPAENFDYYTCGTRTPKERFNDSPYHKTTMSTACREIARLKAQRLVLARIVRQAKMQYASLLHDYNNDI